MLMFLVADPPFGSNVKVSNWDITTNMDQLEVSLAKSSLWIAAHWIDTDWSSFFSANDLAISSDGGVTWKFVWYLPPSDPVNCWIGDPSVASDPTNPNKFYVVGMIYCNPSNPKGEIYFCKNNGTRPDTVSDWTCGILPPNDSWAYFKDKPWIIALGGGNLLVNYTTDKYGNYEINIARSTNDGSTWSTIRLSDVVSTVAYFWKDGSTVYLSQNNFNNWPTIRIRVRKSTDNGATWTSLGDAVSFSPGSSTACPNFNRPAKIHNNITAQGNNIAVAFIKPNGSYCNVGVAYSTDGGLTWNNKYVAQASTDQVLPMITSSSPSNIYVMWQEKVGSSWATKWASSTNWGTTFSSPGRVSDHNYTFNQNPAGHDYNGFIYDGGNLYAIWANDYYGDDAGAVYYAKTVMSSTDEKPSSEHNLTDIKIYRVDGSLVKGDVDNLPKGVYFIKAKNKVYKRVVR